LNVLVESIRRLGGFLQRTSRQVQIRTREPVNHVVILDGTMSSLEDGEETSVGLIYKDLVSVAQVGRLRVFYEGGAQWHDWSATMTIIEGRGINRQIRRAYGWLASRYRNGDRIFLIGYSRGAFAVRSLAGVIDGVGLLRPEHATTRRIQVAYRHYEMETSPEICAAFRRRFCREAVPIEAVAVFDTVKALGFRAPFVRKWADVRHSFHNHELGASIRHGFHALALDETRDAFSPVLWTCPDGHEGHVEQMWFAGTHGDIGGQLLGMKEARPFSNVALTWILGKLEACDLPLPEDWRDRHPADPDAPSVGNMRGWGKFFLARSKRIVGRDPSERIHATAIGRSPRAPIIEGLPPEAVRGDERTA
jgi:uncharacterized protein (DUF2235 family)